MAVANVMLYRQLPLEASLLLPFLSTLECAHLVERKSDAKLVRVYGATVTKRLHVPSDPIFPPCISVVTTEQTEP